MLRLGLLASGHAAGVGADDASAFALRDASAFCRYISEKGSECINTLFKKKKEKKKKQKGQQQKKREEKSSQTVLVVAGAERAKGGQKSEGRKNNVKLAGAAAAAGAVRRIAHVGIIIMIVNNASRLMAPCEGGEDWLESSGRALDMVMRDGLSN